LTISQEIAEGFNKSAQALQAAEAGLRRMGSMAQQQTVCTYTVCWDFFNFFSFAFSPLNLNYNT